MFFVDIRKEAKNMIITGPFGYGKTTVAKEKPKQVAQMQESVYFIVMNYSDDSPGREEPAKLLQEFSLEEELTLCGVQFVMCKTDKQLLEFIQSNPKGTKNIIFRPFECLDAG